MSKDTERFTGQFHNIAKNKLSPNGRILSIWENSAGVRFYRDLTQLSFLSRGLNDQNRPDEAEAINQIIKDMQTKKAHLDAPRFSF